MDAKTQQDVHIEMLYRGNQGYRWLWLPILIHGSEEKMPMVLNKNENIQATTDQWATCQMKSSEPLGKGWKNMDQINKTDISDIISYIYEKNQPNYSISCIYLDYKNFVMQDLL